MVTLNITKKVKTIIAIVVAVIILALGITCIAQWKHNQNLRAKYETSISNEKSLLNRLEKNGEDIIEYQVTIDMLRYSSDSVIRNLLTQQQKLNIKNKDLQNLISMASQFHVHDTLRLCDTIFRIPEFTLDTCFTDRWRSTCLELEYPDKICVDAYLKSQKDVFVTVKKETIDPPKKCALARWFQKKHLVTRVTIHEENPYIEDQENVYITVIDKKKK